jgi:hypothetical protein
MPPNRKVGPNQALGASAQADKLSAFVGWLCHRHIGTSQTPKSKQIYAK